MRNYYRRRLPHLQYTQGEYFVTFRLAGTLPKFVIDHYRKIFDGKEEISNVRTSKFHKLFLKKYEDLFKGNNGPSWLSDDKIAKIVADKLHAFDGVKYRLICYSIMPNHVHLLFELTESRDETHITNLDPAARYPVTHIMKHIKGSTAREANKILGRSGSFWQHESYDRLVRTVKQRENTIRYILDNPVKAGLTSRYDRWKWNYCSDEFFPVR